MHLWQTNVLHIYNYIVYIARCSFSEWKWWSACHYLTQFCTIILTVTFCHTLSCTHIPLPYSFLYIGNFGQFSFFAFLVYIALSLFVSGLASSSASSYLSILYALQRKMYILPLVGSSCSFSSIDVEWSLKKVHACSICVSVLIVVENTYPKLLILQIEMTHRIAWRRSSFSNICTQSTIDNRVLYAGGTLYCRSGCSGSVGSMSFYCTDFSTSEDWSAGERSYIYNAQGLTSFEASWVVHELTKLYTVT